MKNVQPLYYWPCALPKQYFHFSLKTPFHYGQNRPSECNPKLFHSMNYQFWPNFKVHLSPLCLLLMKNELHFRIGDKFNLNAAIFNPILQSDTHSFTFIVKPYTGIKFVQRFRNIGIIFLCAKHVPALIYTAAINIVLMRSHQYWRRKWSF